jgi:hypothetical protein
MYLDASLPLVSRMMDAILSADIAGGGGDTKSGGSAPPCLFKFPLSSWVYCMRPQSGVTSIHTVDKALVRTFKFGY